MEYPRVGAIVFDDCEIVETRPHRRRGNVMRILTEVARIHRQARVDASAHANPGHKRRTLALIA